MIWKGEIMERVINRIEQMNMSVQMQEKLGLEKDWKKKISPKKANKIIEVANRYKEALRKLSKN